MTRKDFKFNAETIRFCDVAPSVRATLAAEFADSLRRTNTRFNREKFIDAATLPRKDDDVR